MAVDGANTLFVNVHVGGIVRCDDAGPTPTLDMDSDVHQVIADPSVEGRVLAACARGLAQSTDGRVFTYRDDGLHAPYCRAVTLIGDTVLISASTGPRSNQARLYRSDLTSGPFEHCRNGLPDWFDDNLDTHCLTVHDESVFAGNGSQVWRSDDAGWNLGRDRLRPSPHHLSGLGIPLPGFAVSLRGRTRKRGHRRWPLSHWRRK